MIECVEKAIVYEGLQYAGLQYGAKHKSVALQVLYLEIW